MMLKTMASVFTCLLVAMALHGAWAANGPKTPPFFCYNGKGVDIFKACNDNSLTNVSVNLLDRVNKCACALVSRELGWASFMSQEMEAIYQATTLLIDQVDAEYKEKDTSSNEIISSKISKSGFKFILGEEGVQQYYWNRLNEIITKVNLEADCGEKCKSVKYNTFKFFAWTLSELGDETYKDDASIKDISKIDDNSPTIEIFSNNCKTLIEKFRQYAVLFNKLNLLTGNPNYFSRLAPYSDNLYKVVMSYNLCKLLYIKEQLKGDLPDRIKGLGWKFDL